MADDIASDLEVSEPVSPITSDMPVAKGVTTTMIAYPALQDYFNIDNLTSAEQNKLAAIWAFFGKDAQNIGDVMYALRTQESRLGAPKLGEKRIDMLHKWVVVNNRVKADEAERDSLLR